MEEATGIIDSPVTVLNTLEEIMVWLQVLQAMPESPQRDIAAQEAATLVAIKRQEFNQQNSQPLP